jgi:hypothetical protein
MEAMTQISISTDLGLGLERAQGPLIVTDEHGQVIGQFIPATRPLLKPEDGCPLPEEELRRRMADALANPTQGSSLQEFWQKT